jgi:hypothetical protein
MNGSQEFLSAWQRQLLLLIAAALTLLALFRVQTTPAPIYASDEYAYLKRAQLSAQPGEVSARDSQLQEINNRLYYKVISLSSALGVDPTAFVRWINFVGLYGFVIGGGYVLLLRRTSRSAGSLFVLLACSQGFSVYVLSLMPDVLYSVMFTGATFTLFTQIERRPFVAYAGAAAISALMLYVKPHAVALVLALVLFAPLNGWLRCERLAVVLKHATVTILVIVIVIFLCNFWLFGDASFRLLFVGQTYKQVAFGNVDSWFSASRLSQVIQFTTAHFLALFLLFPVFVFDIRRHFRRDPRPAPEQLASLFLLISTVLVVAMVVKFSIEVAQGNPGEGDRLHGRYISFLFPALAWLTALRAGSNFSISVGPRAQLSYIGAFVVFVVLASLFRLFPWDYPDILVFFSGENKYWPTSILEFTRFAVWGIVGLVFLSFWVLRLSSRGALVAVSCVLALGSSLRVTYWQEVHAREHQYLADAGRSLRALSLAQDSRLVVAGPDRFGWLSYVLYGYDGFPWVRQAADGVLRAEDVPSGVDVVAVVGPMLPPFSPASVQKIGPLNVFGRKRSSLGGFVNAAQSGPATSFEVSFASPRPSAMVLGFNQSEPWGAWTSSSSAKIVLDQRLNGKFRFEGVAWVAKVTDAKIIIEVGASRVEIAAASSPTPFSFECIVSPSSEEIGVSYPVYLENAWSRPLGVALTQLRITTL